MEIKGYNFNYLDLAMKNLGEAFDYAKNSYKIDMDSFMDMFITSGYAKLFQDGNTKVIEGISGCELVLNIFEKIGLEEEIIMPSNSFYQSCEYWCGWILAYFQWKTSLPFKFIHQNISMKEIESLYPTLHEASEDKFVDIVTKRIKDKAKTSRLKQRRIICGLSQKELSLKSGVNLRTLQQYELKTKNINNASVLKVYALAKALKCEIEDLLELI